jgi:uncharacterized protein
MTGIVHAESRDRARGTQIGIACELRWKLDGAHDGRRSPHPGWARRPGLSDLHHPAFCNPLTAVRDGPLTDGAAACEYTIRFVRVPELTAEPARQRDEPPGNPMVRYCSSSCQANITFDADRFVTPARTIANAPGEAADQGLSQRRNGPAAVLALPMRTCSGYPVTVPDRLPDPAWSSAARWPGPGIPRARCPTTRHTTGGRSSYPANTKAPLASIHRLKWVIIPACLCERCPLNWDDGSSLRFRRRAGRTPRKCDCCMNWQRSPRRLMTRIWCRGPAWSR